MHAAGAFGYRARNASLNLTSVHSTLGSFDGSTGFAASAAETASGRASAVTSNAHFLLFTLNSPRCLEYARREHHAGSIHLQLFRGGDLALPEDDIGPLAVRKGDGERTRFLIDESAPCGSTLGALQHERVPVRGDIRDLEERGAERRTDLLLREVDSVDRLNVGFRLQGAAGCCIGKAVKALLRRTRQGHRAIEIPRRRQRRQGHRQNERNGLACTHVKFSGCLTPGLCHSTIAAMRILAQPSPP